MEEKVQESVAVFNGIEMSISSLDDIWLTQNQIAQLFETRKQNVNHHIKAFLKELDDEQVGVVVKESFTTTSPHTSPDSHGYGDVSCRHSLTL